MADRVTTQAADGTRGRREAQKQWEANPCGASTVRDVAPETIEWFREARRVRYDEYAPWLRATTGIGEIRGKDVLEIGVAWAPTTSRLRAAGIA